MTCYHPMTGYRAKERNESGKYSIVFNPKQGYIDLPMTVPCGQCIGCRLERSRQWAIRCMHEASLHEQNCFLTLTYRDEDLPSDRSLDVKDFQDFMKRFRKRVGVPLRYYHCGEYGEKYFRPHYHACIFGYDFPDKVLFKRTPGGDALFKSDLLSSLWPKGFCTIGNVTFESAAYVARYITKKITGKDASEHYVHICEDTGEINKIRPEYTTMSRRPGIAADWFRKFSGDVYPSDSVVVRGKEMRPPKFYDSMYEMEYPSDYEKIKKRRKKNALKHADNCTPDRLEVREKIQKDRFKKLKRGYESNDI